MKLYLEEDVSEGLPRYSLWEEEPPQFDRTRSIQMDLPVELWTRYRKAWKEMLDLQDLLCNHFYSKLDQEET